MLPLLPALGAGALEMDVQVGQLGGFRTVDEPDRGLEGYAGLDGVTGLSGRVFSTMGC